MFQIIEPFLTNSLKTHIFFVTTNMSLLFIYQKFLKLRIPFKESVITFSSAFFILLLSYFPVITSYYVQQDDYYFWYWKDGICPTHPQYQFFWLIGRPLGNFILCSFGALINYNLENANLLRLIFIFLTACVFYIINRYLVDIGFDKLIAYGTCLILVTGFAFHAYNSWILASYILVPIIFSIFSIWLAEKSVEDFLEIDFRVVLTKKKQKFLLLFNQKFTLLFIISVILYILTLFTYQPASGWFVCFAVVSLLREKIVNIHSFLVKSLVFSGVFCLSNFLYLVLFKLLQTSLPSYMNLAGLSGTSYDTNVLENIFDRVIERLLWFIKVPIKSSLDFVNMSNMTISHSIFVFIILTILIFGIISFLFEDLKPISNVKKHWHLLIVAYKYLILVVCIPFSYLAVIMSRSFDVNYRTLVPLIALNLIVTIVSTESLFNFAFSNLKIFKSFNQIKQSLLLFIITPFCTINIFSTNLYLNTLTTAYSSEVNFLKSKIISFPVEKIEHIKVITPKNHQVIRNPLIRSSIYDINHYSSSAPQHVPPMINTAFAEIPGVEMPREHITSVYNTHGEYLFGVLPNVESKISEKNTLVIDMNELIQ